MSAVGDFLEYDSGIQKAAARGGRPPQGAPKGILDRPFIQGVKGGVISGAKGLLSSAILAGGMYGTTKAIQAATEAVSRNRGFKSMMEANPDLAERDQEQVKGMYNLLHKASPTFATNPQVAGGFIRRTEHASQYVDPKMVADLAKAEADVQKSSIGPLGALGDPVRLALMTIPKE